jgi:hypothetical protein
MVKHSEEKWLIIHSRRNVEEKDVDMKHTTTGVKRCTIHKFNNKFGIAIKFMLIFPMRVSGR